METYIEILEGNFMFIQGLIDNIQIKENLNVKDLEDIRRLSESIKNISIAMESLNNIE